MSICADCDNGISCSVSNAWKAQYWPDPNTESGIIAVYSVNGTPEMLMPAADYFNARRACLVGCSVVAFFEWLLRYAGLLCSCGKPGSVIADPYMKDVYGEDIEDAFCDDCYSRQSEEI